jgi:flagellar biosynthesis/type III secretory pathway protein FliH
MLVSILPVPFGDAGRQRQYEAIRAAFKAEADAPATVLLGNLGAFSPIQADILVVRPSGLALGILTPQAGQLTIPALAAGPWLLDGQPLPGHAERDNPFAQYQQQLPVALAWLSEQFGLPDDELPPCAGVALFTAPLTFGPEVEAQLHRAAHDFQLIGEAAQLPARLRQQFDSEASILTADELVDWAEYLADELAAVDELPSAPNPTNFLEQKLRQLWRWLGAEDIPADPPYGGPPPDQHLRDQQEQARLQQLRQELQAELHQQRQEAAAREAARTQELAQLRQQVAQAGPSATEREAEQRAKTALEESLRTARAELATRNNELDTRIQQLGQLIGQLQTAPAASAAPELPASSRPAAPAAALPKVPKTRPAAPARSFRRLRQAERWGLAALVVAGVGAGTWGVVRWAHHPAPRPAATVAQQAQPDEDAEESQSADQSYPTDSVTDAQPANADTAATQALPGPAASEAAPTPKPTAQPAQLHIDSAAVVSKPTSLIQGTDSAASPTP